VADTPDYTRVAAPVKAGPDAVSAHDLVIADLQTWHNYDLVGDAQAVLCARKRYGLEKYGTVLHADDQRPPDQDAEDEAVDLVVYLRNWMAKAPELREVLEPLYRSARWTLGVLSRLGTGLPAPEWPWQPQFPLVESDDVRVENLVADDEGYAMTQDGHDPEIIEITGALCGGRQINGYTCIRVLSDDLWCPRHGKRVLGG
jgi:hypothetical protein